MHKWIILKLTMCLLPSNAYMLLLSNFLEIYLKKTIYFQNSWTYYILLTSSSLVDGE